MKLIIIILLFFSVLLADSDDNNHHYYSKDLTYLNLTAKQEQKIKKILKDYQKDIKIYKHKKEKITKNKQDIFANETFDEEKLKSINQQINNLATGAEIRFLKQIHQVLSQKQRKEFSKYMDEWDLE